METIELYFGEIKYFDKEGSIYLDYIEVYEPYRGEGFGTKLLRSFLNMYSERDIILEPSSEFGSDKDRLIKWYTNNGFEKFGRKQMIRRAK